MAIAGTLYPLIRLARRFPRAHRLILRAGSGAILVMGILWWLLRTVFAGGSGSSLTEPAAHPRVQTSNP